ncbi:hypothetical protein OSB04_019352 [Centaurea solstitialis]|uniref:Uncharacterized protein n=1 Tax=Centaurea solstitialis TaxID=347529 RepID=A0AA38SQ59_9ASTR|nr:hypothetical protein OSB04_019352 [Centaurea solstitialis]
MLNEHLEFYKLVLHLFDALVLHLMGRIMIACIIMHNMIVEDERDTYQNYYDLTEFINDMRREDGGQSTGFSTKRIANLSRFMANKEQLRNREAHNSLKMI